MDWTVQMNPPWIPYPQIQSERNDLELLDKEKGHEMAQLELVQDTLRKRHLQLDSLDKDVENEIGSKRREIQVRDKG